MESITVGYKPLDTVGGKTFYHRYLVYTDANGNQYYARGEPSKIPDGDPLIGVSDAQVGLGNLSGDSPYGNINVEYGEYVPETIDWDKDGTHEHETIKVGDNLSDDWNKILSALDEIKSENWPYRPLTQNCNTTSDEALQRAGLPIAKDSGWNDHWSPGSGADLPSPQDWTMGDYFNGMPWPNVISPTLGSTPDPLVKTIHFVDPLILDLDGDGLEITQLSKGILFDANGDQIKTGTAWAAADDGMLVRDLNGNGTIDSGAELFGDETLLTNGQKATHGFAALRELDSNQDGQFDASDTQYTNLRLWRDLNQDGISQAAELQTLAESGVQSISLNSSASSTSYGDAVLRQSGSFTRTDGSSSQAGSFVLAQNNFARAFVPIAVSEAAQALPKLAGSGWVRDLPEAASQSPQLIALVNQVTQAASRADYKRAVASLLREWGNDSAYNSASQQALAGGYGLILSEPADAQEASWMDSAIKASAADRDIFRASLSAADLTKFDAMRERMVGGLEKMQGYESLKGRIINATDSIALCAHRSLSRRLFSPKQQYAKGRQLRLKRGIEDGSANNSRATTVMNSQISWGLLQKRELSAHALRLPKTHLLHEIDRLNLVPSAPQRQGSTR